MIRLTPVATNNDTCGAQSRVSLDAAAGQTYWVAVDGVEGASGPVRVAARPDKSKPK